MNDEVCLHFVNVQRYLWYEFPAKLPTQHEDKFRGVGINRYLVRSTTYIRR